MTNKTASLDEIVSKRRASADDNGNLYKAVVLGEEKGFNSESRSQRFVLSSETVDRYGDIVRQDGIEIDDFLRNPVALAYHNHRAPIGWWKDVAMIKGRPKRTEGVLELHAAGTTDAVDEIERLLAASAIKACSIGFMPMEAEWILDENGRNTWGLDFTASSLLEASICSIPANPDALGKAAGGDMRLAAELFERVLDTYCETKTGGLFVKKEFADAYMAMKSGTTTVQVPDNVPEEDPSLNHDALEVEEDTAEKEIETLTVGINVDPDSVVRAGEEATQGVLDIIVKNFASLFKAASIEKTEPVLDEPDHEPEPEPVLASPEAIKEMNERIATMRAKIHGSSQ